MRTPFVAGNWKMNLRKATAVALAEAVAKEPVKCDVGIAPPFVYLDALADKLRGTRVLLGAQDCYFEMKDGAFTGEVSVDMLRDVGVQFVLTGHSERRHVLHEPSELVAKKAATVYGGGLTLVHCVGEKLDERDANKTLQVVGAHLDELKELKPEDPSRLVIAYEPVWAIGTGRTATDAQAQEVHAYVREHLTKTFGYDVADAVRVQYGGSVKPENAAGLLGQPDVDGALVGGAALKADSFLAIARAAG